MRVLLDQSENYGDRDEAATQLADFDGPRARAALSKVAVSDPEELLAQTAADSLSQIWVRTGDPDWEVFRQLKGWARTEARIGLQGIRADWDAIVNDEPQQ